MWEVLVNKIIVVSADGIDKDELHRLGIKHYTVPDISRRTLINFFRIVKMLKRITKEERVTIIHTHHRMAALYIEMLGLFNNRVFINTSHNVFIDKVFLTKIAYRHAHIIACGEMVKKNLIEVYGVSNVNVIHNSVKPFQGEIEPLQQIQEQKNKGYRVVGCIGRLTEQKGFEYYISAIPEIIKNNENIRFLIVGNGELKEDLKRLAKKLGVDSYILWLGYRKDIQNIMSQLDLVVLSSLWEGLPLIPIEAFSVGTPVVATDVDGTKEIVLDGENGYLVTPKDASMLANRVLAILSGDNKFFSQNAKKTYDEVFSYDSFCKQTIGYYKSVLANEKKDGKNFYSDDNL